MADSRRPRRLTAGASSSRPCAPHPTSIEGWISDQESMQILPTFGRNVRSWSLNSSEQKGCIYPDLIRVFYFNLKYRDGIATTKDDEDADMDAYMTEPVRVVAPSDVGPSQMPSSSTLSMAYYFANLSKQLEDMSLAHQAYFYEIIDWQQTHEEYAIEKFEDFDTRFGNIENHLNLQPPERPPSPKF
ncbi:hypothetical protein LR48_Vigan07g121700 [Vigna angularis]|uniref:Uncharacterized protein n=1 Tax=Phaseolus angularis TaxID=3914 RepID=A0A0L9UXM5_PHAAN|nr:hypothetical protein LR48_Vigan07g121700 [Vigna angularis]